MSIRLATFVALGILAAGISATPDAMARPDGGGRDDTNRALPRSDLDSARPLKVVRPTPPKPSAQLQQRELIARALGVEYQVWMRIQNSYDADVYAQYVAKFPRGFFAPLARARAAFLLERRDYERAMIGSR